MATKFLALYRGETIADAQLVAVTADPQLVSDVVRRVEHGLERPVDPVRAHLAQGRRAALRVIRREAGDAGA